MSFPQDDARPAMTGWELTYKDSYSEYYRLKTVDGYTLSVWGASTPEDGNVHVPWHWAVEHESLSCNMVSKGDLGLEEARDGAMNMLKRLRKEPK